MKLALLAAFLALPLSAQTPSHSGSEPPLYPSEVVTHLRCLDDYTFVATLLDGQCVERWPLPLTPAERSAARHVIIVEVVPPSGIPNVVAMFRPSTLKPPARQKKVASLPCIDKYSFDAALLGGQCVRRTQIPRDCFDVGTIRHYLMVDAIPPSGASRVVAEFPTTDMSSMNDLVRYCTPLALPPAPQSIPPGGEPHGTHR
mgnify:CR=1 FL=1